MLYQLFYASLAQALAALSPNSTIASILFSSLFSFLAVFCGVLQPPASMPYFWRSWMYHLDPLTYILEGILGPVLGSKVIRCTDSEYSTIIPPSGQSCEAYLEDFSVPLSALDASPSSRTFPGSGYFLSRSDGNCEFCAYRTGDDYLSTSGYSAHAYGRDLGIIVAYIAFNFALCLGAYWLFRVAKFKRMQKPQR